MCLTKTQIGLCTRAVRSEFANTVIQNAPGEDSDQTVWMRRLNWTFHHENMPIQIYWKFYDHKMKIFRYKNSDIFHISAQKLDCEYPLEPPRRGGSNEYPQSMVLSRNKKNNVYPCKP